MPYVIFESDPKLDPTPTPMTCTACGEDRPAVDFCAGRRACKECTRARRRERYKADRNRYGSRRGWAQQILANKRLYCRKRGLPSDLTLPWLLGRLERCEVTGLELTLGTGGRDPFGPSVDRIDPSDGYTRANCRVVCTCYNPAKSTWTDADVLRMARALLLEGSSSVCL